DEMRTSRGEVSRPGLIDGVHRTIEPISAHPTRTRSVEQVAATRGDHRHRGLGPPLQRHAFVPDHPRGVGWSANGEHDRSRRQRSATTARHTPEGTIANDLHRLVDMLLNTLVTSRVGESIDQVLPATI